MSNDSFKSARLAFMGDLALGGEFVHRARPCDVPLTYPFAKVNDGLCSADVVVVNLEGPIGTEGIPRAGRSALLHNDADILDWLAAFPCCVCTLANNHAMDYGVEALTRTQRMLSERGIHFVGAGIDCWEANRPLQIFVAGLKLSFLSFTSSEKHVGSVLAESSHPGTCGMQDQSMVCDSVSRLAREADAVIVLLHCGHEYFNYPTPEQISFTRKIVDAGAVLVVGHHPHVQQGCEVIDSSLVCHSLGNFFLPEMRGTNGRIQYRKPISKQFAILYAQLKSRRVAHWTLEGGRLDRRYHLVPYTGKEAARFAAESEAQSKPLTLADYQSFWATYSKCRAKELKREAIRDAAAKLLKNDLRTVLKTISPADFRRNIRRVLGNYFAK
jgi:hypothetical protein